MGIDSVDNLMVWKAEAIMDLVVWNIFLSIALVVVLFWVYALRDEVKRLNKTRGASVEKSSSVNSDQNNMATSQAH
jgi:hypothetical protein